jgi:hypothetical protein
MPLSYKETAAPAAEPVSLDEAKAQCVISATFVDDDPYVTRLIVAARRYVEKTMHRAIFNRPMSLWLDYFPYWRPETTVNPNDRDQYWFKAFRPQPIKLPMPGCVSVESITYTDPGDVAQTLDPSMYSVALNSEPARIVPIAGYWPLVHPYRIENVQIDYIAGTYGDGVDVNTCPESIKQAILLPISYWYNHRDAAEQQPPKEIDLGVRDLLAGETFDTFGF